jgi:hypothetical protein
MSNTTKGRPAAVGSNSLCVLQPTRVALLAFALGGGCVLAGCEAAPPPSSPHEVREINRNTAISSAKLDASVNYNLSPSNVFAQRFGGFWVVELRAPSGQGLRYAISARDGSIRERSALQ